MGIFTNKRRITCENSYGYKLDFSYSFPFFLNSYSGVHEYSGNVATIKSAFGVGVSYIGTSVNSRNINLVIAFKDDELMQNHRNQIYNIFPLKDNGTLYYIEGAIKRKIGYYVEKVNLTRNLNTIFASISLICPNPYFMDLTETIVSLQNCDKLLEFHLEIPEEGIEFGRINESTAIEIENNSHIDYGLTITFVANGNISKPSLKNVNTNEEMKLNYSLSTGDRIVVTTYNNEKKIIHIDSGGNETNITNSLIFGTKFLQAHNGINRYIPNAEVGFSNLECSISYYNYYEAV